MRYEFKVNDISETASQAFNTTSTNLNEIINIKMDIMNLKKSNKETAEKLDDNINRSMRSNLVFFDVPEQNNETRIYKDHIHQLSS